MTQTVDKTFDEQLEAYAEAAKAFDLEGEGLATFWRQSTPGTAYWRLHVPAKQLGARVCKFGGDATLEDGHLTLEWQQGDIALWQFMGDEYRSRAALQLRDQGIRTLQEVDDNYLRPAPRQNRAAWGRTREEARRMGVGYSNEMHRMLTPQFDGVIVSTERLAEEYADWNQNVHLCPNQIDPEDWTGERVDHDTLRIGYYGGASHSRDFPLATKALKWAARQPGVELVCIGYKPPGWSHEHHPWQLDLMEARKLLYTLDIGIAPIYPEPWADGKSDLKALEYSMAGAMPILARAEPYRPWWSRGYEWIAQTEDEWSEVIRHVVRNREIVKDEAAKAKAWVLENRTIQKNIHLWKEAIGVG